MNAMKPRVLITRPVQQEAIDKVAAQCMVETHTVDEPMPLPLLIKGLRDADAVMPCGLRVGEEAISAAPNLRVIANIGAGYDNIDLEACGRKKILVTNTPDVLTDATADLAFALLLAAARRIVEGDRYVREGRWPHWQWNYLWGAELHGQTLGLYGCGRIGQAMARRGRGFSMRLLYHSRHHIPAAIERELGLEWVDFDTLLANSDFLSIHVPLTAATRHSIGKAELARMKPTSFLINTARGTIVDEEALVHTLQLAQLRGAGLDVFENEPRVHPALMSMNNVVLLPHIGSATAETRLRMALLAVDNLLAALNGNRPPNLVNPEVLE
jgi:glyoxylate reductase